MLHLSRRTVFVSGTCGYILAEYASKCNEGTLVKTAKNDRRNSTDSLDEPENEMVE